MIIKTIFKEFRPFSKDTPKAIKKCFNKTVELGIAEKGDYYEFGIYKGYTFWYAQKIANNLGINKMRFFGFDSFKGLPEIKDIDKTKNGFFKGQFNYSKSDVERHLSSHGINWDKSFLIEGFYEKTLNQNTKKKYKMDKASVVLIDCDLYYSTIKVLDFIKDMLIDNSIIIFDDWNSFGDPNKGERRAFREFLDKNIDFSATEFFSFHKEKYGKTYIINKKQG
ncbi:MAG: hypothetical protein JSW62_01445 [Thermoplasmatales archaeon]|nr:MAG: hypothetical protein JSW62_01445 [Thermoplasmatales archaeon]